MKKALCLFLVLSLLSLLPACSSGGGDAPPPEVSSSSSEMPPDAPEYDLINSDEYVQGGKNGIGYRVAIGDDATEEDMRAVFSDLCSGDSYALHTVWFYGLASDVETIGSFSVGMLEEVSPGSDPEFTPCTYGEELIASLRDQGGDSAGDVRSIPDLSIMQEALVPDNSFSPAPVEIFSTTAEENGLGDMAFYASGEIVSRSDVGGYDTIQVATEAGDLYISAVLVDLPEISDGEAVTVYFVYTGWSDSLGGACGAYVYSE